jgi:hypothetical protein
VVPRKQDTCFSRFAACLGDAGESDPAVDNAGIAQKTTTPLSEMAAREIIAKAAKSTKADRPYPAASLTRLDMPRSHQPLSRERCADRA